jgi:predicted nuclease of predicted toxin-antitoxin system
VATVPDEGLCGAGDHELIGVCANEGRCLVTLDLDFSNPLVFRPSGYAGIAVLRLPPRATANDLFATVDALARGLSRSSITGKLWIVEHTRIREYQQEEDEA